MTQTTKIVSLSKKDQTRFDSLIAELQGYGTQIMSVARELYKSRLWANYPSFRDCLEASTDSFSSSYITQIVQHCEIVAILPKKNAPTRERQTRPMTGLTDDGIRQCWANATAETPDPTADEVAKFVSLVDDSPAPAAPEPKVFGIDDVKTEVSSLRKIKNRLADLAEQFDWLDGPVLKTHLQKLINCLTRALPEDTCDACDGEGCDACNDVGGYTITQGKTVPATANQRTMLEKRDSWTPGMSKAEASRLIDDIAAKEGWGKDKVTAGGE